MPDSTSWLELHTHTHIYFTDSDISKHINIFSPSPPFSPPRSLRDIPCTLYYHIPYSRNHLLFWLGQPWDSAKVSPSFEKGLVPFRSCLHETLQYLQRPSSTKSTLLPLGTVGCVLWGVQTITPPFFLCAELVLFQNDLSLSSL